ncbi:MAG: 2-C-methyl-D-erythritol 2,4-cyclodiphosphate synthase [Dysgonamonadaceae bacterium]|jgi:2-C-methyl-D-erythritol 2,4-cyclodiphosphate synthase|nr:2-C-methyl-D-erythritol 2,4-cyclodiphosphate synthase [Dysgonamonadaceae bacterium]
MGKIRIGFGYDVHRFAEKRDLWLGGVKLPYEKGLKGHSDADVLIHALCDSLLGAVNARNIGYYFPDTDVAFKNIDSKIILQKTMEIVRSKGYELGNVDVTICTEKPKLNPFIPQMQSCLAKIMEVEENDVSIKATTSEKMGFIGREEGIAAYATALVIKNDRPDAD